MLRSSIFIVLFVISFTFGKTTSQIPPEQIVPLPDFAEYQPEFSQMMQGMIKELGGREEENWGTGMEILYYESVDADVHVYTTSLSIDDVRAKYFDLFVEDLMAQGAPPEAVPQFKQFLEDEVIEEIESDPMVHVDPDMLEAYYREAGAETALQWLECYRKLHPELLKKRSRTFEIEMDERRFRRRDAGEPLTNFTIVEVEVQQPFINPVVCELVDGTAITYVIYKMVASVE